MNEFYKDVENVITFIRLTESTMDDFLYVYDLKGDRYYISKGACERFNLESNDFHDVVKAHAGFVYPPDLQMLQDDLDKMVAGIKDSHDLYYRWLGKNKEPIWINCRGRVVKDETNKPIYMIGCINEIGMKQKADNVSGLLGERSADTFLREVLPRINRGQIMLIGIDGFKDINERMGRDYGDLIIRKTADIIQNCLSPTQFLYHVFADEFMVVDLYSDTLETLVSAYKRMRVKLDYFLVENNYEVMYTLSAGICHYSNFAKDVTYDNISKLSAFALLQAKRNGRNQYYIFDEVDYATSIKKANLQNEMLQSVLNGFSGFNLNFQPLINSVDHKLYGAETLLRYTSENYGTVSPAEFVPILEESGLIIPVGKWINEMACRRCVEIRKKVPDFRISINLSYVQIQRSDIIKQLGEVIEGTGLPTGSIIVEVTESGELENDIRLTKFSQSLKEHGIWLALDDFGTGYSNFRYLSDLRPDIIKFDRSFIDKANEDEYEFSLLSLMSDMAHSLNLKVCAEGIEDQEEETKINRINPDYAQGFYYGRPLNYDEFVAKFVDSDGVSK